MPIVLTLGLIFSGHTFLLAEDIKFEYANANIPGVEENFKIIKKENITEDPGLSLYRNKITKNKVINFYTQITNSEKIAKTICNYADIYNVPLSLAFSLSWAESRFNPNAVNKNLSSIDRGLFQLNSKSFPQMNEKDFFDLEINVKNGVKHLKYCLDVGKNEIVALAIYNAGRTRVTTTGAPKITLDHISNILGKNRSINEQFETKVINNNPKDTKKERKTIKHIFDSK